MTRQDVTAWIWACDGCGEHDTDDGLRLDRAALPDEAQMRRAGWQVTDNGLALCPHCAPPIEGIDA